MENDSLVNNYVESIVSSNNNKNELSQIITSNIIFSLKKMVVLSETIKKQILNSKSSMNEIRLIALGVKIEMINTEIEKIRHEYLP